MKIKSYLLGILFIFFAQNQAMAQPQYEVAFSESLNADIPKDFFSGKYVILDFWQTWCAPCIASFEETNELMAKYDNDALVFANITNETHKIDRIKKILNINPFDGYQLIDADNQTFDQFKPSAFPTVVILDKSGNLIWTGGPEGLNVSIIKDKTGISPSVDVKGHKEKSDYTLLIEPSSAEILGTRFTSYNHEEIRVQVNSDRLHNIISKLNQVSENRVVSDDEKSNDFGIDIRGKFSSEIYSKSEANSIIMNGLEKKFGFSTHGILVEEDVWVVEIQDPKRLLTWKSTDTSHSSVGESKRKITFNGLSLQEIFSTSENYVDGYFEFDPNTPTEILKEKYDLSIPRDPEKLDAQLRKNYGLSVSKKRMEIPKIKLEFYKKIPENFNLEAELANLEALYDENFNSKTIAGEWIDIVFGDEVRINLSFDDNSTVIGTFEVIGVGKNPIEILERKGNYLNFSTTIMDKKVEVSLWFTPKDVAKGLVDKEVYLTFDRVK